jgi:hypothetical protein
LSPEEAAALRSTIAADIGEQNNLGYLNARLEADHIAESAVQNWPENPTWFAHCIVVIGARETNWKNIRQEGGGNGAGYMQIDPASGENLTPEQAMDPRTNIMVGGKILAEAFREYPGNVRAGFARYNCSRRGVEASLAETNGASPDTHTTGKNYGADCIARLSRIDPNPSVAVPPAAQ